MNDEQLTSVWQRIQQRLNRYAHSLMTSDEDAEDALQECFCKLWTKRGDINSPSHAQALAVTMMKHTSIDAHRREETRNFVALDDTLSYGTYSHVAEELEAKETFQSVEHTLMTQLNENERQVFRLKEYDGLTTNEISTRLGISTDAVRKALSRARCTLRKQYIISNEYGKQ